MVVVDEGKKIQLNSPEMLQQLEKLYQLSHDVSISIEEIETLIECLESASENVFKINHDTGIMWLEQLEQIIVDKQPKYIKHKFEDIRDIYIQTGYTSKANKLTKEYNLDAFKQESNEHSSYHHESMPEKWIELTADADKWIDDEESFETVRTLLRHAQRGEVLLAQKALPYALKDIDDSRTVDNPLIKWYLFYHYGIFLLKNDKIEETRQVFEQAIYWAKKEDDFYLQNFRISRLADAFCYKELYTDVVRMMDNISQKENSSVCEHHPFNFGLILYEIEQGNIDKALTFARQINLPDEKYCALDDVLNAYAERGDIPKFLMVANEFNSRENLCFSLAFSLFKLAEYIIQTQKSIDPKAFTQMEKQLRELCQL